MLHAKPDADDLCYGPPSRWAVAGRGPRAAQLLFIHVLFKLTRNSQQLGHGG